jgi:outer membrane biosynthesis protein TonB
VVVAAPRRVAGGMGLSDDQRAMLRLLAQREQGYEDIAALMGIGVEEVRSRVGDALAQLEREGKGAPEVPAPPVAESAPPPPDAPEAKPPAPAGPAESEEGPPAPKPPKEAPVPPAPEPSAPTARARSKLTLPSDPTARAAIAAGILVVALFAIILIINGSSGGGDSGTGTTSTPTAESNAESGSENQAAANSGSARLTKAVLEPVDGSGATGVAIFGRVGKKLALQIEAEGLEPTAKGTSYTLWLAQSPQRMLPLAETAVPKSGRIGAQFPVPVELLAYLASGTFDQLVITRTDEAKLKAALVKARKEEKTPTYTGAAVLAGTVTGPIVGIAKRAQNE